MRHLDPTAAATAVLSLIFSLQLSQLLGPYSVIILGAVCGAAWGLGRAGPMTRSGAVWYFLKLILTAAMVTVPLAMGVQSLLGWEESSWLLVPISLLVGGVGNDWPRVGAWIVSWLGRLLEKRSGTQGDRP